MNDANRALQAAEALLAKDDRPTALVMIAAARARLFLIDERYADAALAPDRSRLRTADAGLALAADAVRQGVPGSAARLARWRSDARSLQALLARDEPRSLFDPRRLAATLQARLPARTS
jgi:hypothetical protein